MISLVAPKRNEVIEHPKMFNASRMGCLNTAAQRVFTAGSREPDYTYDSPRHNYERGRLMRLSKKRKGEVIGAVNQRFQPVPQKTFTITSDETNGVFHRHICDYDSVSGVFIWPNRDPIGELGGLNLYVYVANDPINYYDLYGLIKWKALGEATVGFAVGLTGMVVGAAGAETGIGVAVAISSAYYTGASWGNMYNALRDSDAGPTGPMQAGYDTTAYILQNNVDQSDQMDKIGQIGDLLTGLTLADSDPSKLDKLDSMLTAWEALMSAYDAANPEDDSSPSGNCGGGSDNSAWNAVEYYNNYLDSSGGF